MKRRRLGPPVEVTLPRDRLPTRGYVTADVIARHLGVTEEHVKRNWRKYPFARHLSPRVIRYDPVAFDEYVAALANPTRDR